MPGRVEGIIEDLINHKTTGFSCHKTVGRSETNAIEGRKECAGALITLEKLGHQTQLMQVMHRLGLYEPQDLKPAYDLVIDPPLVEYERGYIAKSVTLQPAQQQQPSEAEDDLDNLLSGSR
jgi:hypothetical protein